MIPSPVRRARPIADPSSRTPPHHDLRFVKLSNNPSRACVWTVPLPDLTALSASNVSASPSHWPPQRATARLSQFKTSRRPCPRNRHTGGHQLPICSRFCTRIAPHRTRTVPTLPLSVLGCPYNFYSLHTSLISNPSPTLLRSLLPRLCQRGPPRLVSFLSLVFALSLAPWYHYRVSLHELPVHACTLPFLNSGTPLSRMHSQHTRSLTLSQNSNRTVRQHAAFAF